MNFNDLDKFNDISAITSTLKNYFRQLPNPLFTFELHEAFVTVASKCDFWSPNC
jgi:Rac GTPase-activating protein 1